MSNLGKQTVRLIACGLFLQYFQPLFAQDEVVPRTPTLPYIENSPFPYASPESKGLSTQELVDLGDEIASWVAGGDPVGAEVLIVIDGNTIFHEAYGWSDRELQAPMERNSIYRIRSMTKPVVGTAVQMLVEKGELGLDDAIAAYLPSFDNERSRNVTVRGLLTHTSGFGNHGTEDIGLAQEADSYESLRALVDDIGSIGPASPPGKFHYSDSGSATLGALVAEVSGMTAEQFITENILRPLAMADSRTRFSPDAVWADRMNSTYRMSRESCRYEKYWDRTMQQRYPFFRATGGLYSTVSDYARFINVWMTGGKLGSLRLLSENTVESALAPNIIEEDGESYGMQWAVYNSKVVNGMPQAFGHGGSDGTLAMAFPQLDAVVLFFTQSRGSRTRIAFRDELSQVKPFDSALTGNARRREFDEQWESGADPTDVHVSGLSGFVGSFDSGSLQHEVSVQAGRLVYMLSSNAAATPLKRISDDVYMGKHPCSGIIFRVTIDSSSNGTVDSYRFEVDDGFETDFNRSRGGDR